MADEKKGAKKSAKKAAPATSARNTNRGVSTPARTAAEAKEARKSMLDAGAAIPPASVDLDVDPTVITTPDTAPDHPAPESTEDITPPQVVNATPAEGEAAATETEAK